MVLVVDETGDIKKGTTPSVWPASRPQPLRGREVPPGVTSQVENCQVAVYLVYTTPDAHALIDHRIYLPSCWTEAQPRLHAAGVPEQVQFTTKPELAR